MIHFVANDGTANSNTATSTVTITAIDTPPTAVNDSATVAEDSARDPIDVLANDTDRGRRPDDDRLGHPAGQRHGGDHRRRHRA